MDADLINRGLSKQPPTATYLVVVYHAHGIM